MKKINFAINLKYARRAKGFTQDKLAQILNVDQTTISAWEKGVCEPSLDMLAKLCDILDESFDSLLS
ncbi:MAG: helix-turn-helix domain-containing protein [Clostridia bacterium]|nr:helix-turn-helix domain-containing protein [Clostridia bacterium]MDE7328271.1 helix-turn-helix domain-containing protein [Clostridia bacterium]